jgi:NAD(P)H-dependent flavin oxidoreductase YrpB (nitropropane dioxygenase family)
MRGAATVPHTKICDLFGIEHPILLAGMGTASTPELAAAVSNAGGLGVIGCASAGPRQLREWIQRTRALTDKPFGVDTLLPASVRRGTNLKAPSNGPLPQDLVPELQAFAGEFLAREGIAPADSKDIWPEPDGPPMLSKEFIESQMDVIIEEKVPVYASGLGSPEPWMKRLKANGTKVLCVVGTVRHALQVVPVGIDAVVAQGHDGGGHNSPIGTMALIPQVVDAVGDKVPVIGAGGISDGRGIAAAMMLGASGVWVGSAFLASEEAGIFAGQKQAIVEANEEGTTVSRSVTGKPARMIKSKWTKLWEDSDNEPLTMPFQGQISRPALTAANLAGRSQDVNPGFAGQGIGMIKAVRPAAEIMAELIAGTDEVLRARLTALVR